MKIKDSLKILAISTIASAFLIGCGSSDNDDSSTGQVVDAPVKGLTYSSKSYNGVTDSNGNFKYKEGEKVTFKLGNLELGSVIGTSFITPYDMGDNNETVATNIALLLQNFDANRSNKDVLDLSKLRDYNFSDINLSADTTLIESNISRLLNDSNFTKLVDEHNTTGLNSSIVRTNMDKYISKHFWDINNTTLEQLKEIKETKEWSEELLKSGVNKWVLVMNGQNRLITVKITKFENGDISLKKSTGEVLNMEYSFEDDNKTLKLSGNEDIDIVIEKVDISRGVIFIKETSEDGSTHLRYIYLNEKALENATKTTKSLVKGFDNKGYEVKRYSSDDGNNDGWALVEHYDGIKQHLLANTGYIDEEDFDDNGYHEEVDHDMTVGYRMLDLDDEDGFIAIIKSYNSDFFDVYLGDDGEEMREGRGYFTYDLACKVYKEKSGASDCNTTSN